MNAITDTVLNNKTLSMHDIDSLSTGAKALLEKVRKGVMPPLNKNPMDLPTANVLKRLQELGIK